MSPVRRHLLLLPLAALPTSGTAQPGPNLIVAAASDLRFVMDAVLEPFRAAHRGSRVEVVYGSSGKLATQIRQGAPFDLFLSADLAFAQGLHDSGLTAGPPRVYAIGRLVLWSTDPRLVRLGLAEVIRHPALKRLAIAHPEHAPYGQRAMEVLRSQGLLDAVRGRLVLGDNVSQAAQFVQTGAGQAGIVAASLVMAPALAGQGVWTLLPQGWHSPLEQAWVLTRRAASSPLAAALISHLQAPESVALMQRHGFAPAVASDLRTP
jgi:molybdate transport system substrate-binding protein